MKKDIRIAVLFGFLVLPALLFAAREAGADEVIIFVSDRGETANWDLFRMNQDGTEITRLTDAPDIENHPSLSPDGEWLVFSSNATGNFELYKAPIDNATDETSWVQLTSIGCSSSAIGTCVPARHPHWSPDGSEIIYTTKDGCCTTTETFVSNCSVPIQITDPCGERYERIHVMNNDGTSDRAIDLKGSGGCDNPAVWHAGHPGFYPGGAKIVFTGAVNRTGTDWEVFVVDWDGTEASNLTQVTQGTSYTTPNPNPIQMSGGAHFSSDGSDIFFSSTRTWKGNSQIFAIQDWETQSLPLQVGDDLRLTWHCGNDYVPDQMSSSTTAPNIVKNGESVGEGKIVHTSDSTSSWNNPQDLDIWIMNPDGSERTNLTNNTTSPEMGLIGDEVSWFCGLPKNLSPCTFVPRAVSIESKYYMEWNSYLPDNFPNKDKYDLYENAAGTYMTEKYPDYQSQIGQLLTRYGEGDTSVATKLVVVPSIMPAVGPGTWCEECVPCDECVAINTSCSLEAGVVGQIYSQTLSLSANKTVAWTMPGLPAGLSFDSATGEISGTPTGSAGTSNSMLIAVTSDGNADSKDCPIIISDGTSSSSSGCSLDRTAGKHMWALVFLVIPPALLWCAIRRRGLS